MDKKTIISIVSDSGLPASHGSALNDPISRRKFIKRTGGTAAAGFLVLQGFRINAWATTSATYSITLTFTDPLIVVSKAEKEELSNELAVDITGPANASVSLVLDVTSEPPETVGSVKFQKGTDAAKANPATFDSITLDASGKKSLTIKVYGTTVSSARDAGKISATVGSVTKKTGLVTVFKGVQCELSGDFTCPVNSIAEKWRPSTFEATAVLAEDIPEVLGTLSTYNGDQTVGIGYRGWVTSRPDTKVIKIKALDPMFEFQASDDQTMANAELHTIGGNFAGTGGAEELINAHFKLKKGADDIVDITPTYAANSTPKIKEEDPHPNPPDVKAAVTNASTHALAKWLLNASPYDTLATNKRLDPDWPVPGSRTINIDQANSLASLRYSWESPKFKGTSGGEKAKKSPAAKALLAATEDKGSGADATPFQVRLLLGHYSEWTLMGRILEKDGSLKGSMIKTN